MPDKAFLDTNVLVYAFNLNDPRKPVAEELLVRGATVGIQTLNEFVSVQAGRFKESWPDILDWLGIIEKLCPPPVPLTAAVHYRGLQLAQAHGYHIYDSLMLAQAHGYHIYDSLMLAAALEASCRVFYSEDMHDGHIVGDMTIRNPFGQ